MLEQQASQQLLQHPALKFSVRHGKSSWVAAVKSIGYPGPKLPLAEVPALPGPAEPGRLAPAESWGCKFLPLYPPPGRQSSASPSTPACLSQIQHTGPCTASWELGICSTGLRLGECASHWEGAALNKQPLHYDTGGRETEAWTFSTSFSRGSSFLPGLIFHLPQLFVQHVSTPLHNQRATTLQPQLYWPSGLQH